MPSPEDERLDVISAALAKLVRQQELADRRLARIETALNLGRAEETLRAAAPPPPPPAPPLVVSSNPEVPPTEVPAPEAPVRSKGLENRVGLTVVNRVGVVTLVLGVGFFFKWAVDNQWIGPAMRVTLGVLASLLAVAVADVLWKRGQRIFAQGITATGICILYLSIYAAFGFYRLIPVGFAFLLMGAATAVAAALAIRYGALAIAALGLLGGFLTPILLSTGENRPWFLFGYILLLDLGALSLARLQNWRLLEILSFAGTAILYGAWLIDFKPEFHAPGTFYVLVFCVLFAAATTLQPIVLSHQLLANIALAIIWARHAGSYFSLALVLVLAALFMADRKSWRFVPSVALASYGFGYLVWASALRDPAPPSGAIFLGLSCAFLAFFAWVPWWTGFRHREARAQDLTVLALNPGAYFGSAYLLLNPQDHAWMGLLAAVLAGMHLALGARLWRIYVARGQSLTPAWLAGGVALTFLTLAVPLQFTAYRITMLWSLEAAALTWIGTRIRKIELTYGAALLFALAVIRLFAIDALIYPTATGHTALWNARFLTFAITAACMWLAAYWLRPAPRVALLHYVAGQVVLLWTLTQEVLDWAVRRSDAKDLLSKDLLSVETVAVSILYAVYAVVLIGIGVGARSALNRIAGLALIGLVVVKLYLFDVWQLSRLHRMIAFVGLGILLLSTSYLYSRFRALVDRWWRDGEGRI